MGYWIYWEFKEELTQEKMDLIKRDYKKLYESSSRSRYKYINVDKSALHELQRVQSEYKDSIFIDGPWGEFRLKVGDTGAFTAKTGGDSTVDPLVKYILLVASKHLKMSIYCDGCEWSYWTNGRNLYRRIFGELINVKEIYKRDSFFS